jgi:hypothetical protein
VRGEFGEQAAVVGRVHHHEHRFVILRRGPQHGGSADVDVLDRLRVAAPRARDRGRERVQIHYQQVNRRDAVLGHNGLVGAAAPEQSAVDLRVQGLEAPAHDLREAGVLRDLAHRDAVLGEQARGAAGGKQLHPAPGQPPGELEEPGLVRNGEQCAAHRQRHGLNPQVALRPAERRL